MEQAPEKLPAYSDYDQFIANNPTLPSFNHTTRLYSFNDNLILNPDCKPGVGVITTWLEPQKVLGVDSAYLGSLYSLLGVDYLIRNCLAHPEIQHLVVAGANINSKITSGTNILLDLHQAYINSPGTLVEYASKYRLTKEVCMYLNEFFRRITIHNLFGNGVLVDTEVPAHWEKVNSYVDEIEIDEAIQYEPLYLSYTPQDKKLASWKDDGIPVIIDASNTTVLNAYKRMVTTISRFGVLKPKRPALGTEDGKGSAYELRGLKIKLDPTIDPLDLTDAELAEFVGTEIIDEESRQSAQEQINEYLKQFLEVTKGSVASYTYGEVIAPAIPRVLEELNTDGYSKISLLRQQNIIDPSPDCLNHISFQIVEGELHLEAYIRSNDMLDAWPKNAYGVIQLARIIAETLSIPLAEVATFSESAHFRDSSYGKVNDISIEPVIKETFHPTEIPTKLEGVNISESEGERMPVKITKDNNGRFTILIGDVILKPKTSVRSKLDDNFKTTIPSIINQLLYSDGLAVLSNPEEVIELALQFADMIATGKGELNFDLTLKDTDEVINSKDTKGELLAPALLQIFKRYPGLYDSVNKEILLNDHNTFQVPSMQLVEDDVVKPEVETDIDERGIDLVVQILTENLFGKSAVFVGNGNIDNPEFLSDTSITFNGERLESSVHQIQFLMTPEGELSATAIVENCNLLSGEFEKVQQWTASVLHKVLEKLLELKNNEVHNEFLEKIRAGKLTLLMRNTFVNAEDIDKARELSKTNVKVYIEDARGSVIISKNEGTLGVIVNNEIGNENFEYSLSQGFDVVTETRRIVKDLIINKGLINDPGHLVYITTSVYQQLTNLFKE